MGQKQRADVFAWVAAAALALTCAACETIDDKPTPPIAPSADQLASAYPEFATQIDMSGRVEMSCRIDGENLRDCNVVKAEPAGIGFEAAAFAIARDVRFPPPPPGESPQRRIVRFSLPFSLGAPPSPPTAWAGENPSAESLNLARQIVARWPAPQRPDPATLDVAADRAEWVADLIWTTDREMDGDRREAWVLALARLQSVAQLQMLTVGQRRAAPFAEDARSLSGQDRLIAFENARALRLRQAYCQRYDCGRFEKVF